MDAFRQVRLRFKALGLPQLEAEALRGQGMALATLGRLTQALQTYRDAKSIFAAAQYSPGVANAQVGEAEVLFQQGEIEQALQLLQQARSSFEAAGRRRGLAAALILEGQIQFRRGLNREALESFRQARLHCQEVSDLVGQGDTWLNEAKIRHRRGEYPKAAQLFRQARTLYQDSQYPLGEAASWLEEGNTLQYLGELRQGLEAARKARGLFQQLPVPIRVGEAWTLEGGILTLLGKEGAAQLAFAQSKRILATVEETPSHAFLLLRQGDLHSRRGHYAAAIRSYSRSRDLFRKMRDVQGEAMTWEAEGDSMFRFGHFDGALQAYRLGFDHYRSIEDLAGQARMLLDEATVRLGKRDFPESLKHLRQARARFERSGELAGQANTWWIEAELRLQEGNDSAALDCAAKARDLFTSAGLLQGAAKYLLMETQILLNAGQWGEAVSKADSALQFFERQKDSIHQVFLLAMRALASQQAGQAELARRLGAEALQMYEEQRPRAFADSPMLIDETVRFLLEALMPVLLQGDSRQALTFSELARSRNLLNLLHSPAPSPAAPPLPGVEQERTELRSKLAQIASAMQAAESPSQRRRLRFEQTQLEARLAWFDLTDLSSRPERLALSPLDGEGILGLSRQDGAGPLLIYHSSISMLWGFLVMPDRELPVVHSLKMSWKELAGEVDGFRLALSNPLLAAEAKRRSRRLWDLLVAPFAPHLSEQESLVLIPHRLLQEIPFAALADPQGVPLFERWHLSAAPSASTLQASRQRHRPSHKDDIFLDFAAGNISRQPESLGQPISALFGAGSIQISSTEADFESYLQSAPQARQILISSRGTHVLGERYQTHLEIQPSPEHDHRLSVAEIAGIELDAELVVLAACDTAAGRALLSDEKLDLARAFLIAGSAAVLATRWKVPDDESTVLFLRDFFQAYRQGGSQGQGLRKDQALTLARRMSRERGDPPQQWAAWLLAGDAR